MVSWRLWALSRSLSASLATSSEIVLTPYARLYRFGTPKTSGYVVLHEGLIGVSHDLMLGEVA